MDTPLVIAALPGAIRRRLVVAAGNDKLSSWIHAKSPSKPCCVHAIPIDRHKGESPLAHRSPSIWCREDWNLLIYPEGGAHARARTPRVQGGAAYLAERSMKTVIPMYITNRLAPGPKYAKAAKFVLGARPAPPSRLS